jgi:hypothetical protein
MCQRVMSYRPKKVFCDVVVHHNKSKYSEKEWFEICCKRLELSMQDPDAKMCYEVFV